jgi:hypothetical protein
MITKTFTFPQAGTADSWNSINWDALKDEPIVLGPGQSLSTQLPPIMYSEVLDIANSRKGYEYLAWLTYKDAFDVSRQTQFVATVNGDPKKFISFSYRGAHNCADDDCPK